MRKKTFIALFTALLAVMFIVTGCSGPDYPGSVIPQGKGSLNLTVRSVGGRTILPKEMTYILVATPAGGTPTADIILYAGSNTISLDVGTYSLALTAYLDGTAIASGTATNVVITANEVTKATIALSSISGGGGSKGTFAWDLSAFKDAASVGIKISPYNGDIIDLGAPGGTGNNQWNSGSSFTVDQIIAAKYMILSLDSVAGQNGFGGLQIAAQGAGNSWTWTQWNVSADWNAINALVDYNNIDPFIVVIDLSSLAAFDTAVSGNSTQLFLSYLPSQVTFTKAFITDADLTAFLDNTYKFSGADGSCWAVKSLPAATEIDDAIDETSIALDAGTYFVEFNVDGVVWQEVLWVSTGFTSEYKPSFGYDGFDEPGDLLDDLVFKAITDGKYSELLGTDFGLLATPVLGVTNTNIGDIRTALGLILDGVNAVPADYDELAELIDAALVAVAADGINPADHAKAEADFDLAPKNGTTIAGVDWTDYAATSKVEITMDGTLAYTFKVILTEQPEYLEKVTLQEAYAVYKFNTGTEDFGNYASIKVSYKMANPKGDIRSLRLMGNYDPTIFVDGPDGKYKVANMDNYNATHIYDDLGAGLPPGGNGRYGSAAAAIDAAGGVADKWFTLTYLLENNSPNSSFVAANKPAADAKGVFYFGVGIPGWGASTQLMRNITMVHKTDPTKNIVVTADDFFGFGAYITNGRYEPLSREPSYNPDYAGPISPFYVDVSKIVSGQATNPFVATPATAIDEEGNIVVSLVDGENQGVGFALDSNQIAKIKASTNIIVTLKATSDPDTAVFRGCIGNITTGSGWNDTDMYLNGAKLSTIYDTPQTIKVNTKTDGHLLHFILQTRSTFVPADVTFESIYIECVR